jgi:cytochrome b561
MTLQNSLQTAERRPLRTASDERIQVFDAFTRTLHWLTFILIVMTFLLAVSFRYAASEERLTFLLQLHRSFGVTVWVVTAIRLIWRQYTQFPNWPADMPQRMRIAAQASELVLYALLLVQPVLGLLYTNAHGDRVNLYFLGQLPAIIAEDRALARRILVLHEAVAITLLALLALHVSAALFHHFVRRDNTLNAMLPEAMRRKTAAR